MLPDKLETPASGMSGQPNRVRLRERDFPPQANRLSGSTLLSTRQIPLRSDVVELVEDIKSLETKDWRESSRYTQSSIQRQQLPL